MCGGEKSYTQFKIIIHTICLYGINVALKKQIPNKKIACNPPHHYKIILWFSIYKGFWVFEGRFAKIEVFDNNSEGLQQKIAFPISLNICISTFLECYLGINIIFPTLPSLILTYSCFPSCYCLLYLSLSEPNVHSRFWLMRTQCCQSPRGVCRWPRVYQVALEG